MENILIEKENLEQYLAMIPSLFREQLISGELLGIVSYDEDAESNAGDESEIVPVGVSLCRRRGNWLEIVWAAATNEYEDTDQADQLLQQLLMFAAMGGELLGAYAECLPEEKDFLRLLYGAGFTVERTVSNVFELDAGMVETKLLEGARGRIPECIPLGKADKDLRGMILKQLKNSATPVPLPDYLDWNKYDPSLSQLYFSGQACGLLLASVHKEHISLDILISQSPIGFPAMLLEFEETLQENMPANIPVSLSVLNEEGENILKKLVPNARRKEVCQAFVRF